MTAASEGSHRSSFSEDVGHSAYIEEIKVDVALLKPARPQLKPCLHITSIRLNEDFEVMCVYTQRYCDFCSSVHSGYTRVSRGAGITIAL